MKDIEDESTVQPETVVSAGKTGEPPASWIDAARLDERLVAFEDSDRLTRAKVVCALHGHACVETGFMGYWHCDRCGDQVGDSLGGSHKPPVIRDHDCQYCREAWDKADFWQRLGVKPSGGGFLQQEDTL